MRKNRGCLALFALAVFVSLASIVGVARWRSEHRLTYYRRP